MACTHSHNHPRSTFFTSSFPFATPPPLHPTHLQLVAKLKQVERQVAVILQLGKLGEAGGTAQGRRQVLVGHPLLVDARRHGHALEVALGLARNVRQRRLAEPLVRGLRQDDPHPPRRAAPVVLLLLHQVEPEVGV